MAGLFFIQMTDHHQEAWQKEKRSDIRINVYVYAVAIRYGIIMLIFEQER